MKHYLGIVLTLIIGGLVSACDQEPGMDDCQQAIRDYYHTTWANNDSLTIEHLIVQPSARYLRDGSDNTWIAIARVEGHFQIKAKPTDSIEPALTYFSHNGQYFVTKTKGTFKVVRMEDKDLR